MIVQLPDGKTAEFPDSMTPQQVESVLANQFSQEGSISTITGEQIPTGEEKISQGVEAVRTMGPIVGDIAMTAVAPQLKAGGIGVKVINALIRATASASGSGAGDLIAQKATGEGPVDMQSAGKQALTGAAAELGGSALMGGLKFAGDKMVKPVVNAVTEFTPYGRRAAEKAAKMSNKSRKAFEQSTTQKAVDFIDGIKGGPDKEVAGIKIGDALSAKKDFKEIYKEYNALIDKAAGEDSGVLLDDFTSFVGELVESEMVRAGNKNYPAAVRGLIERLNLGDEKAKNVLYDAVTNNGFMDAGDAKYFLAKLNTKYTKDAASVRKIKEKLKNLFLEDIGRGSSTGMAAKEAKQKADEIFKMTKQWFDDNPSAQFITGKMRMGKGKYYEAFPERAVDRIFNANPEEALRIKNEVLKAEGGKEAWAGAEFSFLKDMYDRSIKTTADTGKKRLLPDALADEIYSREKFIKRVMPNIWPKLKAEADYYKEIAPQFESIDASDIWGVMSAWDVISPKTKKVLVDWPSKVAGTVTNPALKIGAHMAVGNGDTE